MKDNKNDIDTIMIELFKGQNPGADFENKIMNGITGNVTRKKIRARKIKLIMVSYIGATLIALALMLFIRFKENNPIPASWLHVDVPVFQSEDLGQYYLMIIVTGLLSLISLSIYIAKSKIAARH